MANLCGYKGNKEITGLRVVEPAEFLCISTVLKHIEAQA